MSDPSIYSDTSFSDIGDLPTGFGPYKEYGLDVLYARPFRVSELSLLYLGAKASYGGLDHIIRAVNVCISCDVHILTDGDFEYVMAWLRQKSYPKGPLLVKWTCKKRNIVYTEGRQFDTEPDAASLTKRDLKLRGLEVEVCDAENNEIVHNAKTELLLLDDDDLTMEYDDLDFPRVTTLLEFEKIKTDNPELTYEASIARWIKEGKTLKEKMKILESKDMDCYDRILKCRTRYKHGIKENMVLRCRTCENRVPHSAYPDPKTFFADNSDKNIMDMQYMLMSEFGMNPDDNMPAQKLLYFHSCLAKDKIEQAERDNILKSVNSKLNR